MDVVHEPHPSLPQGMILRRSDGHHCSSSSWKYQVQTRRNSHSLTNSRSNCSVVRSRLTRKAFGELSLCQKVLFLVIIGFPLCVGYNGFSPCLQPVLVVTKWLNLELRHVEKGATGQAGGCEQVTEIMLFRRFRLCQGGRRQPGVAMTSRASREVW